MKGSSPWCSRAQLIPITDGQKMSKKEKEAGKRISEKRLKT
jgi:hypothetical protein